MFAALRHTIRLLTIARTLARHDALFPLELLGAAPLVAMLARLMSRRKVPGRPGQRLVAALQELGPSFIKLGQSLSTRSDLIGEEMADDLSELQDRLPPFAGGTARRTVEAELDVPLDDMFAEFEDKPVAAASIAQVHFAVTSDGEEVAVKVLRPGIEEAFARDLELFYWLAQTVERAQPAFRRLKPIEVVRTLAESVRIEMDLRFEAAAASELSGNFADAPSFRVPRVDWLRTARRVLTLERVGGIPIDERDALVEAGHDLEAIVRNAASAFFMQAFRDGFFHADLHPGNLFVQEDDAITAIDFGIMGRLDRRTRLYLGEMLVSFLNRDYRRVAEMHFQAGYVPADKSLDAFTQACRSIAEPILGRPLSEISIARLLGQLFQVTETFDMEVQPQLLLLQKTMLMAEGLGRRLVPEVNMWDMARPLIEDWMIENRSPEARIRDTAEEMANVVSRLPGAVADLERLASMASRDGLRLNPETLVALGGNRTTLWPIWLALAALALLVLLLD
jgi:ubiquinone biosynthesis protein